MGFEHILVERSGDFATVTMNRPERRNAPSLAHMQELITALREIGDSDALGIVLAGNGPVFCAGHDFADVVDADLSEVRSLLVTCTELMTLMQQVPQPVVARVHGLATRSRLPARRQRRPRRRQRERRLRRSRRQGRLVLPHPDGGGRPQRRPEAGRGDGPVRRHHRRADRAGLGPGQPGGPGGAARLRRVRTCCERVTRGSAESKGIGKQALYAQIDLDQPKAYAYAIEVMAATSQLPDAREACGPSSASASRNGAAGRH